MTLAQANDRWVTHLPVDSPSRKVDFALIHFLVSNLRYPDTTLAKDLSKGMPLVGAVPPTGVFSKRVREQTLTAPQWKEGLVERNREMVRRVTHPSDSALARLCWEKSLLEVEKGWLSEPTPVTEAAINSIPLTPRFAVEEEHGGGPKKIRAIDDLKASMVNDLLGLVDTSIPQNLDTFLGVALTHAEVGSSTELRAFSVDFAHAYKHVGVAADQLDFATVVIGDPAGNAMMATLRTQPFGSSRAPANWARLTSFAQFVLRKVFLVWLGVFVDDCYCVDPQSTIATALWVTRELCSLLGLVLAPDKEQPPTQALTLLGASIQLGRRHVSASLTEKRKTDYVALLKNILRRNSLSPEAAAKIRGKLGFAQSLMFGKYGRAILHEFSARQYSSMKGPTFPLSPALVETIQLWVSTLPATKPRTVSLTPPVPVVIYTDAQGAGHCAAVLFDQTPRPSMLRHTHCPPWLLDPAVGAGIFEFELLAVLLGVCLAMAHFPGRPLLVCCDNEGANAAVIRGSCRTEVGRLLSSLLWRVATESNSPIWIEYVRSNLNVADAPSRYCSDPRPENVLIGTMQNQNLPRRFAQAVSSLDNLRGVGIDNVTEQITQWECPVPSDK